MVAAHDLRCLAAEPDPDAKFGTRSSPPIASSNGKDSALVQGVCLVLGAPVNRHPPPLPLSAISALPGRLPGPVPCPQMPLLLTSYVPRCNRQ